MWMTTQRMSFMGGAACFVRARWTGRCRHCRRWRRRHARQDQRV